MLLCLRSDIVIFGHVNRFSYLLTYLLTGGFVSMLIQMIPVFDDSLREEVMMDILIVAMLCQFQSMSSGPFIF